MANINLLPWREEAREQKKRDYYLALVLTSFVGVLLVYVSMLVVDGWIQDQQARNKYLQDEIVLLDKQIKEIREIKERKRDIERRTEIILSLQEARNLPTHVMDELVRIVPPGIYISNLDKKGSLIWIEGRSESNNHVTNMMRKVKASQWMHDPSMKSIHAQQSDLRQMQRFSLRVAIDDKSDLAESAEAKGGVR
ncbi:PilN domain-containing protein [Paraferrimonas sedimenticola]|uniref:Fimbrial protein n=1 Tax=Paraferrimonas sedimenticola TaxID=375674 RepID=A0AA37W2D0_9GAMM|nr:PilN domain-containing protein [Paraferrimonas sedimenticola]GLP97528.1 fimbrial protein [Paraferrimonas sedimenticola]